MLIKLHQITLNSHVNSMHLQLD